MLAAYVQHCTKEKFLKLSTVFRLYIALQDITG